MTEMWTMLSLGGLGFAGLAMTLAVALKGWEGWLNLKRLELSVGNNAAEGRSPAIERIEIADLKERIRKLESIASCVDL